MRTLSGCLQRTNSFDDERGLTFEFTESADLRHWCQDSALASSAEVGTLTDGLIALAEKIDAQEAEEESVQSYHQCEDGDDKAKDAEMIELQRFQMVDRFWKFSRSCNVFNVYSNTQRPPLSTVNSSVSAHDGDCPALRSDVRNSTQPKTPEFVYTCVPLLPCPDLFLPTASRSKDFVDAARSRYATSYNLLQAREQAKSVFATVAGHFAYQRPNSGIREHQAGCPVETADGTAT